MRLNKWSLALLACSIAAAGAAQAEQRVDILNLTRNTIAVAGTPPAALFVKSGDVIKFDATLTQNGVAGNNAAKTTGLGLCLEYRLAATGNPTIANLFTGPDYIGANPPTAQAGPNCTAGGSATIAGADTVVITPYTSIGGAFPSGTMLPAKLYDAEFTIQPAFAGSTLIGFAASSTGNGNAFVSNAPAAIVPLLLCAAPTVTIARLADGAEPAVNGSFTVTLSSAVPVACGANFPVTVALTGTATLGADYNIGGTCGANPNTAAGGNATVTFPAGTTACTLAVTVIDDNLIEGTETVIGTVATGSGNYQGVGNTATVNIADDDSGVSVVVTQNGSEGGANGIFTFTRTVTAGALVVNYTLAGTATNVADYSITPGAGATAATATSVTFLAGSATAVVNVIVVDDVLVEGTETVILTIGAGAGYGVTGVNPATMNINDNDTPPVVSVSAKTDGAEPATNGSFTLTRAGNPTPAVSVQVTVAGTATRGTDYFLSTGACLPGNTIPGNTIVIPPNALTLTVGICVIDDALTEGNETVILTIGNPAVVTDYTIGAPATQTANIADDDGPTTVTIVATTPNAAEPATNGLFTVSRSGGGAAQLALPLIVNLTISGTATNGTDYANIPATVTILANQTTVLVPVTVIDDTAFEGSETVIATIGASANYTVGGASSGTVTIADNEIGLGVAATTANTIEGGNLAFTISCSTNVGNFTVNYAFSGTYSPLPANGTNVAVNCATGLVVNVPTIDDAIQNGTRTITLTVTAANPAPGAVDPARAAAVGNVLDNDVPQIIPTMSPLGMMLMGLLLAGAAAFGIRRKG